ncbi:MAG: ADP-ribosylglycohydrolase family protein [Planctomycetota bacterium]|jgi:hypothetical protein
MKNAMVRVLLAGVVVSLFTFSCSGQETVRRLPISEYRDKMKAGWIGQIIGVSWGGPTEGRFKQIIPKDKMPPFRESLVNDAFAQDDLYVEMTFLRSMDQYGLDVSIRQAGIDFGNSEYALWVANITGRANLRSGIAPPDSSHPKFHQRPGAIDYQIEADYSGLIAPGMPDTVIALGEKFGRLMGYGDGMYAGQFMGGMYAEAFFEKDMIKIIKAGLKCIPPECQYAGMVRDMLKWHRQNPDQWEKTWELAHNKYRKDPKYYLPPLDTKLEGAYVLMGMLYGKGDPDQTIIISCRCGSDSDCNPSSSGGVLFTSMGISKLPDRYYKALNEKKMFSYTAYNFPALIEACEKLARQSVLKVGGRIEKDAKGQEVFVIPVKEPTPSKFVNIRQPGPIANSRFTDEEMLKIRKPALKWTLPKLLPGWQVSNCNTELSYLLREWRGQKKVITLFVPRKSDSPCTLSKKLEIPAGKQTKLGFVTSCPRKDKAWELSVKVDSQNRLSQKVTEQGWHQVEVDLSNSAGKSILLEIVAHKKESCPYNQPSYRLSVPSLETK